MRFAAKLLALAVFLCLVPRGVAQPQQQVILGAPAPAGTQVGAVIGGAVGATPLDYWVVVHYPIGTVVSGPVLVPNTVGVANLNASNFVTVSWLPMPSATSYDVLRTRDGIFPTSCNACAVATGVTAFTQSDTGGGGSYTLAAQASGATAVLNLNNIAESAPYVQLQLAPNGGLSRIAPLSGPYTVGDAPALGSNGTLVDSGLSAAGLAPLVASTVQYVTAAGNDLFVGTSWGFAKHTVAAAVAALPLTLGGVPVHTGTVRVGPGTFVETATPIEYNAAIHLVCTASGDNAEGVPNNGTIIQLAAGRNTALFSYTAAYAAANGYAHFLQADNCTFDGNKTNNPSAPALVQIYNGGYQNTFTHVAFQNAHGFALQSQNQAVNFSCYSCTFALNDGGAYFLNDLAGANVVSFYDTQIDNSGPSPIVITQALTDSGGSNIVTFVNLKTEATIGTTLHQHVIDFTPRSAGGNPFAINVIGFTAENTTPSGTFALFEEAGGGYGANWDIVGANVGGYTAAFKNNKSGRVSANGEIKHLIDSDSTNLYDYSPDLELTGGPAILTGTGAPNGAVTANVGALYLRIDGGAGTSLYVKETGAGNTGWTAK